MAVTPNTSPASMAQSARDKIQESASHFWSSIRSIEESIKRPIVSPEPDSREEQSSPQVSLESVIRVMFGSCTAGMGVVPEKTTKASMPEDRSQSSSRGKSKSTSTPSSPVQVNEDAMYARLFLNDHLKAEEAVYHLREQMELRKEERLPHRASPPQTKATIPKPFPVSSPSKQEREISVPNLVKDPSTPAPAPPSPPRGATQPVVHTNAMSFDDGISAISQHTLEELAKMYQVESQIHRVHSDITQDPVDTSIENWQAHAHRNAQTSSHQGITNPFKLARTGRSHGTTNTKQSRGTRSMGTKSTLSTQTTEFASAWRKDEQKYWQEVTEHEPATADGSVGISSKHEKLVKARAIRRQMKELEKKARRDGTITTASSSRNSSSAHRHNVRGIMVDDQLIEMMVVPPGTEMGEI